MSELKFTKQQQKAMKLRDKNLLVSAAAGAGKTTVMVERIITMVTDIVNPVGLDRLLAVTFTNAAASEMKERIRRALYKRLKNQPDDINIRKQILLLNQANISTVHSFCSEIIRSNYHLLDIDPAFSVCDEIEASLLLTTAIEQVLEVEYTQNRDGFQQLVNTLGKGRDDSALVKNISSLYGFLRSMPSYLTWMDDMTNLFAIEYNDFSESMWGQVLIHNARQIISGLISDVNSASNMNDIIGGPEGYSITAQGDIELLTNLHDLLKTGTWDECNKAFSEITYQKLISAPRGTPDNLKSLFMEARKRMKKEIGKVAAGFSGDSKTILKLHNEILPMFSSLNQVIHETDKSYRILKNKRGVLDYNDLEHYALECLEGEAGSMYRARFLEIFIDEYQDSNPIQEKIISLVSGRDRSEKNIFMVGDLKQSIYRFRHAEPELFKKRYDNYSKDTEAEEVCIDLAENYRSRKSVLDFSNMLFDRLMTEESADIDYRNTSRLEQGIDYPEGTGLEYSVDIRLACTDDKLIYDASYTAEDKEAAVVGIEIEKIIESGMMITDKESGDQRKVRYSDITILMRSVKNKADRYTAQLSRMGIPAIDSGSSDFFDAYEVIVMSDFLRIIDNPRQDIPLIAVLRSSMFGFTDRELAAVRAGSNNTRFFDCLTAYNKKQELIDKIEVFLSMLCDYTEMSHQTPVDKLIWMIMNETGFYNLSGQVASVESGQANLRRLFEIAGLYENSANESGVNGFIKHLEHLQQSGKDIIVQTNSSKQDAVNILSIHKSKGLEFPVVILAGCGKGFNRTERQDPLTWSRKLGFGPDYINYDKGYKIRTAARKSLQSESIREDTKEELRILYVALTRAREKLIITGSVKNPITESLRWVLAGTCEDGVINQGKVHSSGSYLDWIMACIAWQPSGNCIGNMAGVITDTKKTQNDAEFTVQYIEPKVIADTLSRNIGDKKVNKITCNLSYEEIDNRFSWRYPYEAEQGIHRKISVTELKKAKDTEEGSKSIFGYAMNKRPAFMDKNDGIDAAKRGTLLHNVLAAIDYSQQCDKQYIENLFIKAGADSANIQEYTELIRKYLDSPLGKRAVNSSNTVTEKAFLYPIKAERVYPQKKGLVEPEMSIMLQGIIDCMFFEDGNIIIVDYKSDNVIPGNEEQHALRYKLQLELYSEAAEGLTGLGVAEKYIYFLKTGTSVRI